MWVKYLLQGFKKSSSQYIRSFPTNLAFFFSLYIYIYIYEACEISFFPRCNAKRKKILCWCLLYRLIDLLIDWLVVYPAVWFLPWFNFDLYFLVNEILLLKFKESWFCFKRKLKNDRKRRRKEMINLIMRR